MGQRNGKGGAALRVILRYDGAVMRGNNVFGDCQSQTRAFFASCCVGCCLAEEVEKFI